MHITSLPSPHGIGDLGPWAFRFADFLSETRQSFWQILPLNPTHPVSGDSPYSSTSVFAGNTLLISLEQMLRNKLLAKNDLTSLPDFPNDRVDFTTVRKYKENLFHRAYKRFRTTALYEKFPVFCSEQSHWLDDYARFIALKEHFNHRPWHEWPPEIRDRNTSELRRMCKQLDDRIEQEKFLQYIFLRQWFSLKTYCNERNIQIIGDTPIYVSHDSADVWCDPGLFKLDDNKKPSVVSGVPPDYFSTTGQLWGNPVYRWDRLKEQGYTWWIRRFSRDFTLCDLVRIDHFRGYISYWEVPAHEKTAVNGTWVQAPAEDFFTTLIKRFPYFPVIAEDIGKITPDVREVLRRFEFPGIRPILFAFGENLPKHSCAPHNIGHSSVVYTGTHDLNTVKGWYRTEASARDKQRLYHYLGRKVSASNVHKALTQLAMMTVAHTVIVPLQDILGLDEKARMNLPASKDGNWQWRLLPELMTPDVVHDLRQWTELYGRD
jgi:4-alpha-glucanotransferase